MDVPVAVSVLIVPHRGATVWAPVPTGLWLPYPSQDLELRYVLAPGESSVWCWRTLHCARQLLGSIPARVPPLPAPQL